VGVFWQSYFYYIKLIINGCDMPKKLIPGFVFLTEVDPTIIESVRYAGYQNFLGKPVNGYEVDKIICTEEAAQRLKFAHDEAKGQGFRFVVYDCYRPQSAIDHFKSWSLDGEQDQVLKEQYFPNIELKEDLFKLGYINSRSTHNRGSTCDLTLIKENNELTAMSSERRVLNDGTEIVFNNDNTLDMGTSFDFLHQSSHTYTDTIHEEQSANRKMLIEIMVKQGFQVYEKEWWHFTLSRDFEPYPDTYFKTAIVDDALSSEL
jgi:zinc D-Ala-D-Ala dipeptidase